MRGKKTDNDFVSNFIIECTEFGKNSPSQIVDEAKFKIKQIDEKIKEVENLKIIRSKLLDVVWTFDNCNVKQEKTKSLHLYNIKNHHICKSICSLLKNNPVSLNDFNSIPNVNLQDILFCIKQLLEYKVISKTGDFILRGNKFEEYMKIILQEK